MPKFYVKDEVMIDGEYFGRIFGIANNGFYPGSYAVSYRKDGETLNEVFPLERLSHAEIEEGDIVSIDPESPRSHEDHTGGEVVFCSESIDELKDNRVMCVDLHAGEDIARGHYVLYTPEELSIYYKHFERKYFYEGFCRRG